MISLTKEYALRAVIHLAQHEADCPIAGGKIADALGIPPKYLSKVLGDLARSRVLVSCPGKTGGFALRKPPGKTRLAEVLAPFEAVEDRRCPFGNARCNDENPCLAHDKWKKVVEAQERFLQRTSVLDVAVEAQTKPRSAGRTQVRKAGKQR